MLREKPDGGFEQAEAELPQPETLSKDAGAFLTFFFFACFTHILVIYLFLFIRN